MLVKQTLSNRISPWQASELVGIARKNAGKMHFIRTCLLQYAQTYVGYKHFQDFGQTFLYDKALTDARFILWASKYRLLRLKDFTPDLGDIVVLDDRVGIWDGISPVWGKEAHINPLIYEPAIIRLKQIQ